jgi:transcriptional regulator with PAS, ATPase and Fis domain
MHQLERLIGTSKAVSALEEEIERSARSDAKILLTGESGVGKEVVARLIHDSSRRRRAPMVSLNCAGVPESLLESELFGHARGAFTGAERDRVGVLEAANGGTIFLDEIGEMSQRMQALLLRFLENGEIQRVGSDRRQSTVDVRVIAATNRNLTARIATGDFREDLYYRLNVIHITVPPLRERREDILPLFEHYLSRFSAAPGAASRKLSPEAAAVLTAYPWPGNVRELKNVAERVSLRKSDGPIRFEDLPPDIVVRADAAQMPGPPPRRNVDALFERMVLGGESFWLVVYDLFMSRDLTRDDLRSLLGRGLRHSGGNYKRLLELFNLPPKDQRRFLSFLWKYDCQLPLQTSQERPREEAGL